ncbi:MAG: hypothetical protein U0790_23945 [Isosphaeraceae bacterium]
MARQRKPKSLFRRLIYFIVMALTGGAGAGGFAFKDHPVLQAVLGRVLPKNEDGSIAHGELKEQLASAVSGALKLDDPKKPGLYRVKVSEVRLDPKLFKAGRTVDIQARVRKRDAGGKETIIWESRQYGENLGQVGKDDLTATWSNRPFEVDWAAGDKIAVEIWDRKGGFFEKKDLWMSPPEAEVFPLTSGAHPLSLSGASLDPGRNRIVFESQIIGDSAPAAVARSDRQNGREASDRPIIIR